MKYKKQILLTCFILFHSAVPLALANRFCPDQSKVSQKEAARKFKWLVKCESQALLDWFNSGYSYQVENWTDEEKLEYISKAWIYDEQGELRENVYYPLFADRVDASQVWSFPNDLETCQVGIPLGYEIVALCSSRPSQGEGGGGAGSGGQGYVFSKEKLYSVPFTSEERSVTQCEYGNAIAGYGIAGGWSAAHHLVCTKEARTGEGFEYTRWISHREEDLNTATCQVGWVVDRVICAGENCSDIQLGCRPLDTSLYGKNYQLTGCREQKSMSDGEAGTYKRYDFGARHVLVGLKCEGDFCDFVTPITCSMPNEIR